MMGLPSMPMLGAMGQQSGDSSKPSPATQQTSQQGAIMQLMSNPMFKAMMAKYTSPGAPQQPGMAGTPSPVPEPLTNQMNPLMSALLAQRLGVVK